MDLQLNGKRALVTGGASGLGAELCRQLAAEGAAVCINYRSREDEARTLVDSIEADGGTAVAIQADLNDIEQVHSLFRQAVEALGGIDILVNNAGIWDTCEVGDISHEVWDRSININLKAPMFLCQDFINHCVADGRPGRILNVTSQAAFQGSSTGHVPYATAKAGMVTMTRSLVREMKGNGVTANCLAIGMMESPMTQAVLADRLDYYTARIPVGYVATAEDVANVALFLCSPKSSYMTGATVDVSGGQLMH